MHRGSSKGTRSNRLVPESLPLSASSADETITIEFEVVRAGRIALHSIEVVKGTMLRVALRAVGLAAEGSAVLDGDRPMPLDSVLDRKARLTVVPTFSGG